MNIYCAGPLFTKAEIDFNKSLYEFLIQNNYQVFLPQDECLNLKIDDVFLKCVEGIDLCDVILANLDGADADSGTCWECGYAYKSNKPIIAYRTDFRGSGDIKGFNAMIYYGSSIVIDNPENLFIEILEALKKI